MAILNFDVLIDILSVMDSGPELLPTMSTCRTLYQAGVPILLKHPVIIRTRAKLVSFCLFMLRDGLWRFHHLRQLEISVPGRFKATAKASLLVAMFTSATSLQQLKIYDCEILLSDVRLLSTISKLTAIHSITLHALNGAAGELLNLLEAKPTCLDLCFYGDTVDGPGDPSPLLSRHTTCLRELRVTYVEFVCSHIFYPHLTTLVVDDCQFATVEPLVRCFPHLRDLSVWMGHEDDDLERNEIEEHRTFNDRLQRNVRWTALDSVRGSILSLYMLHLTCTVGHLDVNSDYLTADSVYQLSSVLADVLPSVLTVRIDVSKFDVCMLQELLRNIPLSDLIVYLDLPDSRADFMVTMKMLIRSLRGIEVRSVTVHPQYVPVFVPGSHGDGARVAPSMSKARFEDRRALDELALLAAGSC